MSTATFRNLGVVLSIVFGGFAPSIAHADSGGMAGSPAQPSFAELERTGEQLDKAIETEIRNVENLNSVNALAMSRAFTGGIDHIHNIVMRSDFSDAQKVRLIQPLATRIGGSFSELTDPFTDMYEPRETRTAGEWIAEQGSFLLAWTWSNIKFWTPSAIHKVFKADKPETVFESFRRAGIGKQVITGLHSTMNDYIEHTGNITSVANDPILSVYGRVLEKAVKTEPYRNVKPTRAFMRFFAIVGAWMALAPRSLHPIGADTLASLGLMEPTWGSYLVGRFLFAVYTVFGVTLPRVSTGYSLGKAIESARADLEARANRKGIALDLPPSAMCYGIFGRAARVR